MIVGNSPNLCSELFKVLVSFAVRTHVRDKCFDLLLKGRFAWTRRERFHYSFADRIFNQKSFVGIHDSQNGVSLIGRHVSPLSMLNSTMSGIPQTIRRARRIPKHPLCPPTIC